MASSVLVALKSDEVQACAEVMLQLRPHLTEASFLSRVIEQMKVGYRLACVKEDERVVAVAGFRIGENLAWGKFMYVDDLVTDESERSNGYGKQLLGWLKQEAKQQSCTQLHLDSGLQRKDAHRFYERENMTATGYHFAITDV